MKLDFIEFLRNDLFMTTEKMCEFFYEDRQRRISFYYVPILEQAILKH